jgi:cytochrome o ubiquinol oxidase operon protein cyoD
MSADPAGAAYAYAEKRRAYLTGFVLALVLTMIPFALVGLQVAWPRAVLLAVVSLSAIAQILVHLSCFLHLNLSAGARWNLLSLLFTALILVIMAGGTLWILFNLHMHMAPG